MIYHNIEFPLSPEESRAFLGNNDNHLRTLEKLFSCDLVYRNGILRCSLEDEDEQQRFAQALTAIREALEEGRELNESFLKQIVRSVSAETGLNWQKELLSYTAAGKPIYPKTAAQAALCKAIATHRLTFSIGPAGTGKTFLAVVMAVKAFKKGEIDKIVLTRPAVEAGESLGFLPGDLKEKVDPYLMPLYDSLDILIGHEQLLKLQERGAIEVIPLAYMRGRTLNDAFIILDEAQNTTDKQMLMFLTRLGSNARMVVNGDITQIDLKIEKARSGLVLARKKLQGIEEIGFIDFENHDVVRNPLVEKIVEAYTE